jgi:hypothetical protein
VAAPVAEPEARKSGGPPRASPQRYGGVKPTAEGEWVDAPKL